MAYLLSKQDGNWSSSGTWEVASSIVNLTFTGITTLTTTYQASASNNYGAITVSGVWLGLYSRAAVPSGTLDVQLWNATTSAQAAIVTVNVSELLTTPTLSGARGIVFRFSSPVTLVAGNSYQIRLKTSAANQVGFWRNTSTNWCNLIITSTNAAPSVSDVMFVQGYYSGVGSSTPITVTMDNNNSTAYAGLMVGSIGILDWLTTSDTQLRLNGEVWTGAAISLLISPGVFSMGSTASRIAPGVTANLTIDAGTNGGRRIQIQDMGTFIAAGSTMSHTWTTLNQDVAVGATSVSTAVTTGWNPGDTIVISPTIRHANTGTTIQYERRTISSISGTSIGATALSFAHAGTGEIAADIINLTRNCKIQSLNSSLRSYITVGSVNTIIDVSDVEFENFGSSIATGAINFNGSGVLVGSLQVRNSSFNNCGSGVVLNTSTNYYNCIVDNCVYSTTSTQGSIVYAANAVTVQPISSNSYISNNCMIFGGTSSTTPGINIVNNSIDVENNSVSGIQAGANYAYGTINAYVISGKFNNNKGRYSGNGFLTYFTDTIRTGNHATGNVSLRNLNYGFYLPGSSNARIENLVCKGNSVANLLASYNAIASTYDVEINNSVFQSDPVFTTPVGILISQPTYPTMSTSVSAVFNDCTIGLTNSHTTADIRVGNDTNGNCDLLFNNCLFGSSIEVSQPQFMSRGSKISLQRADQTNGAHRTYFNNGALTIDTTIYRSSSKSVRLTPSNMPPSYQAFGKKIIPVRAGAQPTVSVWVRKSQTSDGSNYNGTQPRLWMKNNPSIASFGNYDNVLLAACSSSNGTWEQLSATLPVVPYEDTAFEVYLDCSGTVGWVNVDDWKIT
jgi:hypothetical protein